MEEPPLEIENLKTFFTLIIKLLISFILQNTTPNDIEFHYADLNNDNHLNIFDIILLVNTILE